MVGLCGVIGTGAELPDGLEDALPWRDDEVALSFADDGLELSFSFHRLLAGDQPARSRDGDVLVWVWGEVYGVGGLGSHTPRQGPPDGSAAFCAELYDDRGMEFVDDLNGNFALVVYDRDARTVSFATDRLGTHPVFYARPTDDSIVVSSHLQSLPAHPEVDAAFDVAYLYEYLQLRRVLGVETPLEGVREFPPGSVVTVDLDDFSVGADSYWRPHYAPVDRSFDTYLDLFVETFETVLDEWTRDDLSYGILLSGGSDSRFVQGAIDRPVTAFHTADWMSREARTARRVAEVAGDEFRLLERGPAHEAEALERNGPLANFSGWFDQAYFTGFEDEIASEVDVLVSGLYADTLFDGNTLPTPTLSLGPVGDIVLPVQRQVDSIDEYVRVKTESATEPLSYVDAPAPLADVLRANVRRDGDGILSHGVRYDSLTDLVMYGDFYPMTADTDAIFSRSLAQMLPYRTPYLDNRLLDLQQRIPRRYLLRRNFVHRATARVAPALAEIPHARTGVPIKHSFLVDYLGGNVNAFCRKHLHTEEDPPEPYLDHGPWPDRQALLRTKAFPIETIVDNRERIRALPFLDYEGALACYNAHVRGEDNTTVLYSLLTLLETPVAERALAGNDAGGEEG